MNAETFCEHFATFAEAPNGVAKLREMILQLAVQGKLVPQDPNDDPASDLRARILSRRKHFIASGEFGESATDPDWLECTIPHTLPNGWEWVRLGELGGFLGGGTPTKERAEYWNGAIPWVSPKDMKRLYINDAIDHVSELGVANSSVKMVPPSSLLMVVRGMILAHSFPVALSTRELTINQDMKALQLALPEIGEYLLRCCAASKSRILKNVERSSHGTCRLPTNSISNFPIPLPPLAEQKRIVEKVDQLLGLCDELESRNAARREARSRLVTATLDRLVSSSSPAEFPTQVNRVRDNFDRFFDTPTTIPQLRQTILQLAVQGKLVPQDPNDEPARNILARIQHERNRLYAIGQIAKPKALQIVEEDEIPFELPSGWEWTKLGNLCFKVSDGPHHSPAYVSRNEGVPFLSTRNVRIDGFDLTNVKFVSHEDHSKFSARTKAELGDILYTKGGTTGIARVNDLEFEFSVWVHVAVLKIAQSELLPKFIEMALNSPLCYAQSQKFTQGISNNDLGLTRMVKILVPLPPLTQQKKIVTKVNELMSLCDELESTLIRVETASTEVLTAAVHHLLNPLTSL